jgi:hypothetical protein
VTPTELEVFLLRLLQHHPSGGGAEYLPRRVPDTLPFPLPLPEESNVAGTVVRGGPRGAQYNIVLDVALPLGSVLTSLGRMLSAEGWTAIKQEMPGAGGFLRPQPFSPQQEFFHDASEFTMFVSAQETSEGVSEVRLRVSPIVVPPRTLRGHERRSVLPPLLPPTDVGVIPGGGGGSNIHQTSYMGIETSLDLASLAEHYAEQLAQAGWESAGSGETPPLAWSTWRFHDEDGEAWYAIFFAFRVLDLPNRYLVELQAYWTGAQYER